VLIDAIEALITTEGQSTPVAAQLTSQAGGETRDDPAL
jgi:hypothetical protein